jgi:hypothetical protein
MTAKRWRGLELFLLAAACSGTADANLETVIDTLPGGGVVVTNRGDGVWRAPDAWRVVEEVRIGRAEGDGPDVFGRIASVALGADGTIYVFDRFARELRVFDDTGRSIGVYGRRGGGPEEFEAVIGMDFAPDGALWLVDAGNGRYARFEGGRIETVRRPIGTYIQPWLGGWEIDGSFYDQASVVQHESVNEILVRMNQPGSPVDSLGLPTIPLRQPRLGSMSFPLPFAPRQLWAFDARGLVWTALSNEYILAAVSLATGDTLISIKRVHHQQPLGREQRDSVHSYASSLKSRFGVHVTDDMLPLWMPVLRWMVADDRGHLWVCATGPEPCDILDVFDPGGVFLGSVSLPSAATSRPAVRGDRILLPVEGRFGEPVILLGRISGRLVL